MEVERLTAVFEVSGLAGLRAAGDTADRMATSTRDKFGALAEVSRITTNALQQVKVTTGQALDTEAAANRIKSAVGSIPRAAVEASDRLAEVKLKASQAAETDVVGDRIDRKLKDITGNANEARRALESVLLAGIAAGREGGGSGSGGGSGGGGFRFGGAGGGRNGAGFGPFGSGFGRVGLMGTAIAGGTLLGPSAGPAVLGLLAAIPVLAGAGIGVLGTLTLAFHDVGKAIGGDKKAFDSLTASQQQFVLTVRSLTGWLHQLRETAAAATFPGLTAGLHAALSPGTVAAITTAVTEFGHAIGAAGEQWGRYFGSSQFQSLFGPLMLAGANALRIMSGAALSLFDALGVLGRAAIPFTTWLLQSTAAGTQWLDTFLRAKDATGGLSGALNEAHTSLVLVALLVASLGHAVGALGAALYPISKVAVKDLTDGLNALAAMITRNQDKIREIAGGALTAFVGAVQGIAGAIREAMPVIRFLADLINNAAGAVGGWKTVVEALLALKFVSIIAGWTMSLVGFAGGATAAEGASAGLLGRLNLLKRIGPIAIPVTVAIAGAVGLEQLTKWAGQGLSGAFSQSGGGSQFPAGSDPASQQPIEWWATAAAKIGGKSVAYYLRHGGEAAALLKKAGMTNPNGTAIGAAGAGVPANLGKLIGGGLNAGLYGPIAAGAATQYGVPVDLFLKQIKQESGFNPAARSKAGALGIAQFMPATAAGYGINPMDPNQALPAAAKMMAGLYAKYHDWGLALAAYNAGSGNVDAYLAGKRALPAETTAYVQSITGSPLGSGMYGSAPAGGGSPFGAQPPWTKNLGPKPPRIDKVLPPAMQAALTDAQANAAMGTRPSLEELLTTAQKTLDYLNKEKGTTKDIVELNRERKTVAGLVAETERKISALQAKIWALQAQVPPGILAAITNAKMALSTAGGSSASGADVGTLQQRVSALRELAQAQAKGLDYLTRQDESLKRQHASAEALKTIERERNRLAEQLAGTLAKLEKVSQAEDVTRRVDRILGIGGNQTAGLTSLRSHERSILTKELAKFGVMSDQTAALGLDRLVALTEKTLGGDLQKTTLSSLEKINLAFKEKFLSPEAVANIQARFRQIEQTFKTSKLFSTFHPVSAEKLTEGLGLDRLTRGTLEARIAQAAAHHMRVPAGRAAAGVPLTRANEPVMHNVTLTIHVVGTGNDAEKLAKQIAPHIESELLKTAGRTSRNTGGRGL